MLVHTNSDLRKGILSISQFHQRDLQLSSRITWKVSCLSAGLDVFYSTGFVKLHSRANNRRKGFGYTKMSSQVMEKMGCSLVIKENSQDLPLSSAYEAAMEALSSLITRQKRGDRSAIGGKYKKLDRMLMYIKILGLEEHIASLKIIHVAGTKGKGSTCTFCEAILRECGFRTGLFTSPHLIDVRERFRLNGLDICEDKFLLYFWDCWNQLKVWQRAAIMNIVFSFVNANNIYDIHGTLSKETFVDELASSDEMEKVTEDLPMPPLFQFLTIMAFKIFIYEKVDVAIIEVGLGGENDSTNVIEEPVACGITSLGMDHMEVLGNTLEQIASHKAGIFKPHIPAFTVPQLSEAMVVLQEKAGGLMVPLEVAAPLDCKKLDGVKLSLSGDHQLSNAGLAVSLCKSWLRSTGNWEKLFQNNQGSQEDDNLPEAFVKGLSTAHLSGRAQIVHDSSLKTHSSLEVRKNSSGDLIFYLDGAHSPESMEACAKWFSDAVKGHKILSPSLSSSKVGNVEEYWGNGYTKHTKEKESYKIFRKILLFNCMEIRDPQILLPQLVNTCASSGTHFSKAIFVPSMSTYNKVTSGASVIPLDNPARDLSWQFNLQRIWEKIIHGKDDVLDNSCKMDGAEYLPPREFLYEDVSHCRPAYNYFACSAVIPSLPLTINWLRGCVRENPSLRIQVLVTGSLHLVGDVLKLIRR